MINHFVKYQLASTLLGSVLLLAGCAGTSSGYGCNATTSDSCMTMRQANEKAKLREKPRQESRIVVALPSWLRAIFNGQYATHYARYTPRPEQRQYYRHQSPDQRPFHYRLTRFNP